MLDALIMLAAMVVAGSFAVLVLTMAALRHRRAHRLLCKRVFANLPTMHCEEPVNIGAQVLLCRELLRATGAAAAAVALERLQPETVERYALAVIDEKVFQAVVVPALTKFYSRRAREIELGRKPAMPAAEMGRG